MKCEQKNGITNVDTKIEKKVKEVFDYYFTKLKSEFNEVVSVFDKKLDLINEKQSNFSNDLLNLKSEYSNLKSNFDSLNSSIDNLNLKLGTQNETINNLLGRIVLLENSLCNFRSLLTNHTVSIVDIYNKLGIINNEINQLKKRVTLLEARVDNIDKEIEAIKKSIPTIISTKTVKVSYNPDNAQYALDVILDPNTDNISEETDQGILTVAPASKVTTVYVRSFDGSDTVTNSNGEVIARAYSTETDGFKTIESAIGSTPNGSEVDVHIHCDSVCHLTVDGNPIDHTKSAVNLGAFNIGNRTVNFASYGDELQKSKQKVFETILQDGTMSWGLKGVKKPIIYLNWKVLDNGTEEKLLSCRGFNGGSGSHIKFQGIDLKIYDIDLINTTYSDYKTIVGWWWNGLNYTYLCCNFGKLPKGDNQSFGGDGGVGATNITFNYVNYFEDGDDLNSHFFNTPFQLTLYDNSNGDGNTVTISQTGDAVMNSNTSNYIQRDSIFTDGVYITYNPVKSYKNLNTNFEIKFLKFPERLTS